MLASALVGEVEPGISMISAHDAPSHVQVGQPLAETQVPSVHSEPAGQKPAGLDDEQAATQAPSRQISSSVAQAPVGLVGVQTPAPQTPPQDGSQVEVRVKTHESSTSHSPAQVKLEQSGQQRSPPS
jgi:hypothetical protein